MRRFTSAMVMVGVLGLPLAGVSSAGASDHPAVQKAGVGRSSLPARAFGAGKSFCGSQYVPASAQAHPLSAGAHYKNVYPCAPIPDGGPATHEFTVPSKGSHRGFFEAAQDGFQCVELANRFLWVGDGLKPINGARLDGANYVDTEAAHIHSTPVENTAGGAQDHPYLAGDVVSFTGKGGGHVAVVVQSGYLENGPGTYTVALMEENASVSGLATAKVINWVMQKPTYTDNGKQVVEQEIPKDFLALAAVPWSITSIPLPSRGICDTCGAPVACISPYACLAGFSYDQVGTESARLVWGHATSWTTHPVPTPRHTVSANINALACASAVRCVATAGYSTSPPSGGTALLVSGHGSNWTATPVAVPPNGIADSASLWSVTCVPGGNDCLAIGEYVMKGGDTAGLLVWGYGATWRPEEAPAPAGQSPWLYSAACASATRCAVLGITRPGYQVVMESGHGSSWKPAVIKLPAGAAAQAPQGQVTCRGAGPCLATVLGEKDGSVATAGWLESGYGTVWTRVKLPVPAGGISGSASPLSVACGSPDHCLATGYYSRTRAAPAALLLTGHGTTWAAAKAPLPPDADKSAGSELATSQSSVSCAASGLCASFGYYTTTAHADQDLLIAGSGTRWTAARFASYDPATVGFEAISCSSDSSASACAIGVTILNDTNGVLIWGPN